MKVVVEEREQRISKKLFKNVIDTNFVECYDIKVVTNKWQQNEL